MNTGKNDGGILYEPVPDCVRESWQKRPSEVSVHLRIREGSLADPNGHFLERVSEVVAETRCFALVPVLDRLQIELGRSTDDDTSLQRRRFARRDLTSSQELWSSG